MNQASGARHRPETTPDAVSRRLRRQLADRRRAGRLRLLLDYDGTLVPIAPSPEQAPPDRDLLDLLEALSRSGDIDTELVSGRPRAWLETWFGSVPIALWAEHGCWHSAPREGAWTREIPERPAWLVTFAPLLERFAAAVPGSRLETKEASIVWHFRGAPVGAGDLRARQLRSLLHEVASDAQVDVLEGRKVIEVRPHWIGKGIVARRLAQQGIGARQVVAFGDDPSDDELFRALPRESLTVAVGQHMERARHRLRDYRDVRELLWGLVRSRRRMSSRVNE